MTSDVQVTVRTENATRDSISYKDYWEIYHFELRKWNDSVPRRDGKKSPDGKVLMGDYMLSLDDFCEAHSPDMSKAMWSKIHKALREYVDIKALSEDEKTTEEIRAAALGAIPAAEAEVAKALTWRARNILRRAVNQPELPISVDQALADVDPDAKVVEIGNEQPPRHVLLIGTSQALDIHVNGTVTARPSLPARPQAPKPDRPKVVRPAARKDQVQRYSKLRTQPSWSDIIERGLRSYEEEESAPES
ncbi:MAG: hypothetical protein U0X20_17285 [Caldilineaceae bacterium]